jgi:cytochrome bd-type quinol oxidase subunit 2
MPNEYKYSQRDASGASTIITILVALAVLAAAVLSTLTYIDLRKIPGTSSNNKNMSLALLIISWITFVIVAVAAVIGIGDTYGENKRREGGLDDNTKKLLMGGHAGYGVGLGITLILLLVITVISFVLYYTIKAKYSLFIGVLAFIAFVLALISAGVASSRQAQKYANELYESRTSTVEADKR